MDFTILERLTIMGVMPKKGNVLDLKKARDIRDVMTPTEKEQKKYDIKTDEFGSTRWSESKSVGYVKEIPLSELQTEFFQMLLERLNKENELPNDLLNVYVNFVEAQK